MCYVHYFNKKDIEDDKFYYFYCSATLKYYLNER